MQDGTVHLLCFLIVNSCHHRHFSHQRESGDTPYPATRFQFLCVMFQRTFFMLAGIPPALVLAGGALAMNMSPSSRARARTPPSALGFFVSGSAAFAASLHGNHRGTRQTS